jgi:hypothetical protein
MQKSRSIRLLIDGSSGSMSSSVSTRVQRSGWERMAKRFFMGSGEVKSVIAKDEPLTPGILYIGVAGLAGSVLARNRTSTSLAAIASY